MRKTLLLLLAMLIAMPAFAGLHKKHYRHLHENHAKAQYKQSHTKRESFKSEHPKAEHAKNSHVQFKKARKHPKKSSKHRVAHPPKPQSAQPVSQQAGNLPAEASRCKFGP